MFSSAEMYKFVSGFYDIEQQEKLADVNDGFIADRLRYYGGRANGCKDRNKVEHSPRYQECSYTRMDQRVK